MLRSLVLLAAVWAYVVPPVLCAATPQEQEYAQDGSVGTGRQSEAGAESAKSAVVTAITSDITVDGLLDEEVWRTAPKIGELTQREPRTGERPSERTDVTLLRDANNLYVGVMCYDTEPQRVIGTQMARDATLTRTDDWVTILLDTYRDQRNAFLFSTNPAGALVDGLVFANGQSDMNWNAIWTVRTRRTSEGWSAEFAIPFKSLSFPADRSVWGFNIARMIQRKLEEDRWSGARLEVDLFHVSEAGEITNLNGLTQGIGLDIRPFAAGRWLYRDATGKDTVTGKPGLDVFYNFTPSLKLTATVNTDFGETEADARQINLTRFSLFFPEKRSFFLEDAGVFTFASTLASVPIPGIPATGSDLYPFFSRQIGLLSGEEVPLEAGLKLTGKIGRTDLGVLDVRSGDLRTVSAKNFFVGRVKRNVLRQSYLGAMFTTGNPALPASSSTFGTDARLATSRFLGRSRNFVLNAYGLRSLTEGNSSRDASYGVSAEYPNDNLQLQFIWRDVQENFRPALGFVPRRNVRVLRVGGSFNPRPKRRRFLSVQQMFLASFYTRHTRLDNGLVESSDFYFTNFMDWHFNSGDAIHRLLDPNIVYERLFVPFQISPGVILPPGEYRFIRWKTHLTTASKRRLLGSIQWLFGSYWSGDADQFVGSLTYKIPPRFNISVTADQTFATLPQGNFVARLLSGQVNYAASPFLTVSNLIQYDNRSRNLGWQNRVRWILQPGNDLFFVFEQGWIEDRSQDPTRGHQFRPIDRKVSVKLQYTSRF
ncbi:MAG: carbohydrate binding family 9 domain-containing protein [Acidobacteria bacterium]|nr:carbohydrate binding family 9 domain-containing protein [Acidobacteriota bacterium]